PGRMLKLRLAADQLGPAETLLDDARIAHRRTGGGLLLDVAGSEVSAALQHLWAGGIAPLDIDRVDRPAFATGCEPVRRFVGLP
ncbi:MAG: hypothetical protein ACREFX_11190, partial [Opitutaceae bacterium]